MIRPATAAGGKGEQQTNEEHECAADRSGVHRHLPSVLIVLRSGEIAPDTL